MDILEENDRTVKETLKKYGDIINIRNYEPQNHVRMDSMGRAAQFAPFAALTGYGEAINETARVTDSDIDLDDSYISELDYKLNFLLKNVDKKYEVKVTYYEPDKKKQGGAYLKSAGSIKKTDDLKKYIVMDNGLSIKIDTIIDIDGNIFR